MTPASLLTRAVQPSSLIRYASLDISVFLDHVSVKDNPYLCIESAYK